MIDYERSAPEAGLAAPALEHFLPLLYVLGARDERDRRPFLTEGFDMRSVSMRSMPFA